MNEAAVPAAQPARLAAFARSDFDRRVARLQRNLVERDLDGAVYTERANFEYLTGVSLPPLWSSYTRLPQPCPCSRRLPLWRTSVRRSC